MRSNFYRAVVLLLLAGSFAWSQPRRKVIVDEDCSGPGGSDLLAVLLMIRSPEIEVLGVTVVSGDQWRDEEVAHVLRLLEIIDRVDIPVMPGAAFPLLHTREEMLLRQEIDGKVPYTGAWDARRMHDPSFVPPMKEGHPTSKASSEDAAHFLIRMVHKYPHEVTIYEGGPMTNLAVAQSIDSHFAELAQELVFMGGSLNPLSTDPGFANNPRHEFNFWFDPEAARIVLRAPWKKITGTPTDVSIKTKLTPAMVETIDSSGTALGHYIARYFIASDGLDIMWDELAAATWIDPTVITRHEVHYMGVNIDHGPGYGDTLTWTSKDDLKMTAQPVDVVIDFDPDKFYGMFVRAMTAH